METLLELPNIDFKIMFIYSRRQMNTELKDLSNEVETIKSDIADF